MDESSTTSESNVRQRLPQQPAQPHQLPSTEAARDAVLELNAKEERKSEKDKRTYGRTPDGKVFVVPQTHDMVSQLLSPTQPKNASDLFVLAILACYVFLLWALPRSISVPTFAVLFLFWRAMYNGGIGWLLYQQSNQKLLVSWAQKYKIFHNPAKGDQPHPALYRFLKREFETKIPKDYSFDDAPLEYNTWLLFRRFVDLVLMCDFVCYCCFAIACGHRPAGEHAATTVGRWAAGIALFLFNLWVKLDAHRVVKDFAWYWGDFFYLIDQALTFDGVFEMAPHPMYSVGYAGFYGISLMAASYRVLFISIVGHAAQFAFLYLVESPHIEKTYNAPPARLRPAVMPASPDGYSLPTPPDATMDPDQSIEHLSPVLAPTQPRLYVRNLIGPVDLHRSIDIFSLLLQFYLYSFAIMTPSTLPYQAFFAANAIFWRMWYSVGIGYILILQSRKKKWTRHFIKYGESSDEAWRQWKRVYHVSMIMCYASFVSAAYKMYTLPPDWEYGMATLRHVLGFALIALQLWTVVSIYDSLGEFGWFFGDFFFDQTPKLTYSGIYRFLNNPERVIGVAGVWGMALITWSRTVFFIAVLSHALTLGFLHFVERPHMERRYGQKVRRASGVSKTFNRSLPKQFRDWQGRADRVLEETVELVEEFIESARPKLAAGYDTFVKDTKAIFKQYPARLTVTRLAPDMTGFDPKDYSLEIEGTPLAADVELDKTSKREGEMARKPGSSPDRYKPLVLEYGAPIKVRWTAPAHHSKRDWIGLYMITDNASRDVTHVPAQGRWVATNTGAFDSSRADEGRLSSDVPVPPASKSQDGKPHGDKVKLLQGEVEFTGDKLWWTTGVFEFRLHHDGKHNVMAVSKPFEVKIPRFDKVDGDFKSDPTASTASFSSAAGETERSGSDVLRSAIEQTLLPVVRNCFDRDPDIAPSTIDEPYGSLVERDGKFARRVVYAVGQMFGIDFAPSVVRSDGNVRNMAWRICNAKRVLAPYSMSAPISKEGRTTPTELMD